MLICITGIDGAGKTTQIDLLKTALTNEGHKVFISKAYGEKEKQVFEPLFKAWDSLAITFMFQALYRQQFVEARCALRSGHIVIADRWDDPYLTYHSQFGLFAEDKVLRERLNSIVFENCLPDITFLLKISVEEAEARMNKRGKDFFDNQGYEHYSKIAKAYLNLARSRNWFIIDGAQRPKTIHDKIFKIIKKRLNL